MTERPPMPMPTPKKTAWYDDPRKVRDVVEDFCRVLGLSTATRELAVEMALHRDDSDDAPDVDERVVATAVEDVAAALERHGIRLELMGMSQAAVHQMVAEGLAHQESTVEQGPPAVPTADDRRAIVHVIGQLRGSTRRRVFKTSNMLVIGGVVRAALFALGREAKEQAGQERTSGRRFADLLPVQVHVGGPVRPAADAVTTPSLIETPTQSGGSARIIAWVVGALAAVAAGIWALATFLPGIFG